MAGIEVSGLRECLDNMKKLNTETQQELAGKALREAGWVIAEAMRGATYTTGFKRITGALQRGISVAVQHDPKADELKAYVVEYPQSIAGAETPFKALVRKRRARSRKKVDVRQTAYWWLFLERGTEARKSVRTPKGRGPKSLRPGTRSARALARWQAAASRGGIRPMPWLQPAFNAKAVDAINTCRDTIKKLIDAAVSAMPKR
jgi:HK97 gp10 family phage protein